MCKATELIHTGGFPPNFIRDQGVMTLSDGFSAMT